MTNKKSDGEEISTWRQWLGSGFLILMVIIGLCNFIPWVVSDLVDDGPSQSEEAGLKIKSLKNEIANCVNNTKVSYSALRDGWITETISHATSTLEEVKSCLANL